MENSNSYIFSERKEEMPISSVKLSFRKADNPDECLRHYFFGQLLSTTEGIYVTSFLSKLQNAFKAEMSNAELSVLITNEKDESKQKMFIMASRKIYPAVVSFAKENDIEFRDKQVSDLSLAPLLNLMLRLAASGKDVNGVNRLAPGTFDFGVYYFLDKKDHGRRYEAIGVSFGQEIGKSSHASIKVETKSFYPVPEGDEKNFSHYFVCQNSVGKLLGCSSIPLEAYRGKPELVASLLEQCRETGIFDQISGVLLGTFSELDKLKASQLPEEILLDLLPANVPIAKTEFIGHRPDAKAIRLGQECAFKEVGV